MNLYPRSFLHLILIAWAIMALPLVFAIAFAWMSVTHIAERSDATVQEASQAAQLGWELEEDLVKMERLLYQYEVLGEDSLLVEYATARREWRQFMETYAAIPLIATLKAEVDTLLADESAAQQRFVTSKDSRVLLPELKELEGRVLQLVDKAKNLADHERQAFRDEAQKLRQKMLVALLLAMLLAGVLFWFGQRIIATLLHRVEQAVIVLGNNLLDRRIRFKGPEDMQWIGRKLDWLRRRLRSLEEERTRMLRHISHELKTPLAALREGSSLLSEGIAGPLSPQQAKIAGIMQGNALRLQELIDGLLKLQQAEHAREHIQPDPIRLDELIQSNLKTHSLTARNKRLRVSGSLTPLTIAGGREAVTAIVNNVISNAIKFSPKGATVRLSLKRDGDRAVFDVIDEGPGIAETERQKVFEPFYRTSGSRGVAGAGLGLAIAREFAEAQRGSLDLMESPVGAHFRTTLPLAEAAA